MLPLTLTAQTVPGHRIELRLRVSKALVLPLDDPGIIEIFLDGSPTWLRSKIFGFRGRLPTH